VCYSTNSCVQMKPLQLIATNSNYADWATNWCKKDYPQPKIDAKSFCCMITLDRMLRKAGSKHFYNLNGKSSHIQRIFLAPSDHYLFRSIQHALTDTYFSSYEEVQKLVDEWIASKDTAFCHRKIAREMGKNSSSSSKWLWLRYSFIFLSTQF